MAVDRGYGSGSARSAANSASRRNSAASAGLRKKGIKKAGRKYTSTATAKAKSVSGSSDYVARENAARTQLGTAGVAARARQFPTAARATARGLLREVTGIDVSRKGVSVSPESLAMALPVGKVLKAAKALRAAGNIAKADSLTARVVAKAAGGSRAAVRGQREQRVVAFMRPDYPGIFKGPVDSVKVGGKARDLSESVFPRLPSGGGVPGASRTFDKYYDALEEGASRFKGRNVSEGTLNIVDTRRMNQAQAKSALEGGVNQTAVFKRRGPSAPKKVNKVTKRLLGGR